MAIRLAPKASIRQAASKVDSMALITAAATTFGIGTWATLGMLDESFEQALLTLQPSAFGDDTAFYGIVKGYAYRARGLPRASLAYFDSAEVVAERRLKAYPADPNPLQILAWTKAVDGRAQEAYETMDRLVKEIGNRVLSGKERAGGTHCTVRRGHESGTHRAGKEELGI